MSTQISSARGYQNYALRIALQRNVILRMDTGTGKTFVAIMVIKDIASRPTIEGQRRKLIFFIVPTTILVNQQQAALEANTSLRIKRFVGADGVDFWKQDKWTEELSEVDVVVCTYQILLNILRHAFWDIKDISLIVFDEAHRCKGKDPSHQIMLEFYYKLVKSGDEDNLPQILGMTASATHKLNDPTKDLKDLESNLDSKLIEVDTSEFDRQVLPPTEKLIIYNQERDINYTSEIETDFQKLGVNDDEKRFEERRDLIKRELGRVAADIYISELVGEWSRTEHKQNAEETLCRERIYSQYTAKLPQLIFDPNHLGHKIHMLVDVLLKYREYTSFCTIIFVETRYSAIVIAKLLEKIPELNEWVRAGSLIGHAGRGNIHERAGMEYKQQTKLVDKFRKGEVNVLVATEVAEEGLDFGQCNLIVRLDRIKTIKSYTQSRGRARAPGSSFMVFAPSIDMEYINQYHSFVREEPAIKILTKSFEEDDIEAKIDLSSYETFTVPSKGATLTYGSAVSLLNYFCSLLPADEYTTQRLPTYDLQGGMNAGFQVTIYLPMIPGVTVRTHTGKVFSSKSAARASAAFGVCKALYEAKLLDDHLLPVRESRSIGSAKTADGETILESVPKFTAFEFEHCFGDLQNCSLGLFLNIVRIRLEGSDGDDRYIGFLSTTELSPSEETALFRVLYSTPEEECHEKEKYLVSLIHARPYIIDSAMRPTIISKLSQLNLECMKTWINKKIKDVLVPVWLLVCQVSENEWDVSWDEMEKIEFRDASVEDLVIGETVGTINQRFGTTELQIVAIREDVNTHSPLGEIITDPNPSALRVMGKCDTYYSFLAHLYRFEPPIGHESSEPEPLVEVETIIQPRYTLQLDDEKINFQTSQSLTKRFLLPPRFLHRPPSDTKFKDLIQLTPGIIRIVQDKFRIRMMMRKFNMPSLDEKLMIEAMTLPTAGQKYNYQTLETLGDSVLKVLTTIHTYLKFPRAHEGHLDKTRQNSIDNRFLRLLNTRLGYGQYCIPESFKHVSWSPNWQDKECVIVRPELDTLESSVFCKRDISRRVLSDTIESTLGASYLSGGLERAFQVGNILQLCFGPTMDYASREDGMQLLESMPAEECSHVHKVIENNIGYTFKRGNWLRQALIHRSFPGSGAHCYEREEFLGDALLDFWMTSFLYNTFPNTTSSRLTFLKAMLVSNVTLAFVGLKVIKYEGCILHGSSLLNDEIKRVKQEALECEDWSAILSDMTWSWDVPRVLGDVFESILGAAFVDSGYSMEVVDTILRKTFANILPIVQDVEQRDPASLLLMHRDGFHCTGISFHNKKLDIKKFECTVTFHGQVIAIEQQTTKSIARQMACKIALNALKDGLLVEMCAICRENEIKPKGPKDTPKSDEEIQENEDEDKDEDDNSDLNILENAVDSVNAVPYLLNKEGDSDSPTDQDSDSDSVAASIVNKLIPRLMYPKQEESSNTVHGIQRKYSPKRRREPDIIISDSEDEVVIIAQETFRTKLQ